MLCTLDYENENEFQSKLSEAIMLLLGAGYICTVREDEVGIIVIEYDHDDSAYGSPYPYWLTPEQAESVPLDNDKDSDSSE
jgi:hypothetical protein